MLTGSFAAVLSLDEENPYRPGYTYSHKDFNPATPASVEKQKDNGSYVYCASKVIAEQAAWDYVKETKPHWSLTVLLPPLVLGPITHPVTSLDSLNTSSQDIKALFDAKKVGPTGFPVLIDVRDLGDMHVAAATKEIAAGKRYLIISHHFSNEQNANILRRSFPDQASRFPDVEDKPAPKHYATDSSLAEKELGFKSRPKEETIRDAAQSILDLEKQVGKQ